VRKIKEIKTKIFRDHSKQQSWTTTFSGPKTTISKHKNQKLVKRLIGNVEASHRTKHSGTDEVLHAAVREGDMRLFTEVVDSIRWRMVCNWLPVDGVANGAVL
jgi:hypothetical protein